MRALDKEQRQTEIAHELMRSQSGTPCHEERDPESAADKQSWREAVFELALEQFLADDSIADRTKRIFERVAINGESPEVVAASFKMTRHAVDQAKSRAMARLREIAKGLEDVAEV